MDGIDVLWGLSQDEKERTSLRKSHQKESGHEGKGKMKSLSSMAVAKPRSESLKPITSCLTASQPLWLTPTPLPALLLP